jgi:hypothetical protein
MRQAPFEIKEVSDLDEVARCKAQNERAGHNSHWLQSHWADLLPHARGKFVAVAGQEAFIADTPEEAWAWAWANRNHPEDNGALVRCVRAGQGPLTTKLELTRDDGIPAQVRGQFAAFTDPTATDLSILGRDVFIHFGVIVSHRRNDVLLLAADHQYRVEPA